MKRTILLSLLLISGCEQMDKIIQPRTQTPEERAQQMYLAYLGLLLMQSSQPAIPQPQIYIINGRQIVCRQLSNNVVSCL